MIVPSLRALLMASTAWLVCGSLFALSLFTALWQSTPVMGLVRGISFIALGLALSALVAAWLGWAAHRPQRYPRPGLDPESRTLGVSQAGDS